MFPDSPLEGRRRTRAWRRHAGLAVLGAMGGCALLLLVLSVFGDQGLFRIRTLAADREVLRAKVAAVERESAALRRQLEEVREGKASYELTARQKLGLVKPGEVVYDFRDDPLRRGAAPDAR